MKQSDVSIACSLSDNGYSIAIIKGNKHVLFSENRVFSGGSMQTIGATLADEVERWNIIAQPCQLILLPGQYQLILMDALDIPEDEMAKALRWSLKGLSDYDLDDVAVDVFSLPVTMATDQKKAYVALTPLSLLKEKRLVLESAYLELTAVSIADMALKNLAILMHKQDPSTTGNAPVIFISDHSGNSNGPCKLMIIYQDLFYLIRELTLSESVDEPIKLATIVYEIERSIDYCVNTLGSPEPEQLFFTPEFHSIVPLFQSIKEKLNINVTIIDLNHYLDINPPLPLDGQHDVFYTLIGALR